MSKFLGYKKCPGCQEYILVEMATWHQRIDRLHWPDHQRKDRTFFLDIDKGSDPLAESVHAQWEQCMREAHDHIVLSQRSEQ